MKSDFIKFLNELSKKANNFEIPFDKYNYRRIPDFEQDYKSKSNNNNKGHNKIKRYLKSKVKHNIINLDGKIIQDKHGFTVNGKEIDSKFLSFKEKIKHFFELTDSFLPLFFKLAKNYNFIFIPKNFEGKLKLFNFIDDFYSAINFILVDKNVKCDIVDEYINISKEDQPSILSASLIFVEENSDLKHYVFTSSKVHGKSLIINNSVLYKNSSLKQLFACFSKGYARYESNIKLEGEKARAIDYPVFFSWQSNFYDFLNRISHIARETFSRIEARGVLKDNARAVVRTKAIIGPKAINADSLINDYAILLSDKCHIDSIPSLEILNNNVKATHSAYTESIGKEKIFYMQTRGLDDKSAKSLYISGFMEKLLGNTEIKDKIIKDIQHLI